jgi:hypothetical protein
VTLTLDDIKSRLALIQEQIEGVRRAYTYGPDTLPPGDLPLFVTFIGPAQDDWKNWGADYDMETRQFLMRLYVMEEGAGITGESERNVTPFLERVRDMFAARPGLGTGVVGTQLAGVMEAQFMGDKGISILPYGGDGFIGAEFTLQVGWLINRQYDDGE